MRYVTYTSEYVVYKTDKHVGTGNNIRYVVCCYGYDAQTIQSKSQAIYFNTSLPAIERVKSIKKHETHAWLVDHGLHGEISKLLTSL